MSSTKSRNEIKQLRRHENSFHNGLKNPSLAIMEAEIDVQKLHQKSHDSPFIKNDWVQRSLEYKDTYDFGTDI